MITRRAGGAGTGGAAAISGAGLTASIDSEACAATATSGALGTWLDTGGGACGLGCAGGGATAPA